MSIAYLINQYPKVSHSFIRREIQALEALGLTIHRFAIRSCEAELVDPLDVEELQKTKIVLDQGLVPLIFALVRWGFKRPRRTWQALKLAVQIGLKSEAGLFKHIAYLCEACSLLDDFQTRQVTHVHSHFGTNSTTVAMLCHQLGGPSYSFTVHGPEEFDKPQAIALPEKIKRAAYVFAISSFTRSQLFRWCDHIHWDKINVIRCGLDGRFLQSQPLPVPESPQLVCVGRLCEQKGTLLLVTAAKLLKDQGYQFKLVLVGDGEMRPEVEQLIDQFGLQSMITITGWASSDTVLQHIQAARTLVLPSFAEGLPVVLMEALSLHRPVISTYVAGIPELVVPGNSGWLVPAGSIEPLVDAMAEALTAAPATLQILGQQGAERVKANHDSATIARQILPLFKAAAGAEIAAEDSEYAQPRAVLG